MTFNSPVLLARAAVAGAFVLVRGAAFYSGLDGRRRVSIYSTLAALTVDDAGASPCSLWFLWLTFSFSLPTPSNCLLPSSPSASFTSFSSFRCFSHSFRSFSPPQSPPSSSSGQRPGYISEQNETPQPCRVGEATVIVRLLGYTLGGTAQIP